MAVAAHRADNFVISVHVEVDAVGKLSSVYAPSFRGEAGLDEGAVTRVVEEVVKSRLADLPAGEYVYFEVDDPGRVVDASLAAGVAMLVLGPRRIRAVFHLDVTAEDPDATDTLFLDTSAEPLLFYLVTGVGPNGEGPKGHFGE